MSVATATNTHVCAYCGDLFERPRTTNPGVFCSAECNRAAFKDRRTRERGETAVILPSEHKPKRKTPMTDDEFKAELKLIRRNLDEQPYQTGDRFWRMEKMAMQRMDGWRLQQIAVYHGVGRDVVKGILGE